MILENTVEAARAHLQRCGSTLWQVAGADALPFIIAPWMVEAMVIDLVAMGCSSAVARAAVLAEFRVYEGATLL